MPSFTPLYSSTFTGANEDPISEGGVWLTDFAGPGTIKRDSASGTAQPSGAGDAGARYIGGVQTNDGQYSRADLTTVGTTLDTGMALRVRCSATVRTFYIFIINHNAGNNASIWRVVASVYTQIAAWPQPFTDGNRFTMCVENQVLDIYDKNLQLVQTFNDAGLGGPTTGRVGIAYSSAASVGTLADNWEGGNYSTTNPPRYIPSMRVPKTR